MVSSSLGVASRDVDSYRHVPADKTEEGSKGFSKYLKYGSAVGAGVVSGFVSHVIPNLVLGKASTLVKNFTPMKFNALANPAIPLVAASQLCAETPGCAGGVVLPAALTVGSVLAGGSKSEAASTMTHEIAKSILRAKISEKISGPISSKLKSYVNPETKVEEINLNRMYEYSKGMVITGDILTSLAYPVSSAALGLVFGATAGPAIAGTLVGAGGLYLAYKSFPSLLSESDLEKVEETTSKASESNLKIEQENAHSINEVVIFENVGEYQNFLSDLVAVLSDKTFQQENPGFVENYNNLVNQGMNKTLLLRLMIEIEDFDSAMSERSPKEYEVIKERLKARIPEELILSSVTPAA